MTYAVDPINKIGCFIYSWLLFRALIFFLMFHVL
jgi:hypothetical protein